MDAGASVAAVSGSLFCRAGGSAGTTAAGEGASAGAEVKLGACLLLSCMHSYMPVTYQSCLRLHAHSVLPVRTATQARVPTSRSCKADSQTSSSCLRRRSSLRSDSSSCARSRCSSCASILLSWLGAASLTVLWILASVCASLDRKACTCRCMQGNSYSEVTYLERDSPTSNHCSRTE